MHLTSTCTAAFRQEGTRTWHKVVLTSRAHFAAQISPEKSVSSQLAYLATASQARDNGRFVDYNGNTMDW
jgi:hypothetical protein